MNEQILTLLKEALGKGLITVEEAEEARRLMGSSDWDLLQPILDKAQSIQPLDPAEDEARLKTARGANPLHRVDFTEEELEKLKALAPEEYELLSPRSLNNQYTRKHIISFPRLQVYWEYMVG